MPELPEVETVRLAISKVVNKALIEKVDIFRYDLRWKIKDDLKTKTSNAFKKGVFGAPTFIVGSKMFFGQDRLEFVFREAKK